MKKILCVLMSCLLFVMAGCSGHSKNLKFGAADIGGVYYSFASTFTQLADKEIDGYTFETKTISLQNGSIHDCRGCSYEACLHFAAQSRCFYGGSISDDVLPAISRCDAMLFLCPNYNDAVSANLMALFNRLTNLLVRQDLYEKYLYGIVVSGYSGSDIVARQLLGAMCLNKTAILPPEFCLMQTAHDPGSVQKADGIDAQLSAFAARLGRMQG